MIDRGYCRLMARYNAWQNGQLREIVGAMPEAEVTKDRKAFFGSILSTLNHILWADALWLSRFTGGPGPAVPAAEHARMTATSGDWSAERFRMDGRIRIWADKLSSVDLASEICWTTVLDGRQMRRSLAECAVHLFNHQVHHRGQVHAMLTAAGRPAPVTDIVLMPDTF